MTFGDAIVAMQNGMKVYRPAWDQSTSVEPGAYLHIGRVQDPEAKGGERDAILHCVGVGTSTSSRWIVSGNARDVDVLADDWEIRQ